MSYSFRHKLLTMSGRLFTSSGERWSASLRFNGGAIDTVSQAQVDAAFTVVKNWFTSAGPAFPTRHSIEWVKLAPIGIDGKYPPGEDSVISSGAEGFGVNTTGSVYPAQCTVAVSLMTGATRGLAWTGRFYPPAPAQSIGTDGLLAPSGALSYASSVAGMLTQLNAVPDLGLLYVMSDKLGGTSRRVTGVRVGCVIDTQRRRRSQLVENYQAATVS